MVGASLPIDPSGPPVVETARLLLRPLRLDDVQAVWDYASDAEVARYTFFDAHESQQQTYAWLELIIAGYALCDPPKWAVVLKEEDRLVGSCGMKNFEAVAARVEIGYALARRYWGRGIATEAVRAMAGVSFDSFGLNRLEAKCVPEHVASRRVLERAGFEFEGILREHEFFKGKFQDVALYSLLRRDWKPAPKV